MIDALTLINSKLSLEFETLMLLTWRWKLREEQTWPPATPCTIIVKMINYVDLIHWKSSLEFETMMLLTWRWKQREEQTWPPATPCTMVGSQSAMWNRLLIVPDACLRSHFEETGRKQSSLNLVQIWDECRNPGSPFQQVAQAASQGRVWAPSCSRALQ